MSSSAYVKAVYLEISLLSEAEWQDGFRLGFYPSPKLKGAISFVFHCKVKTVGPCIFGIMKKKQTKTQSQRTATFM